MNIGIIGLGLIGGSMAKAVKTHTEHTVYGCDKIESIQLRAKMVEAIDDLLTPALLKKCDIILIALFLPGRRHRMAEGERFENPPRRDGLRLLRQQAASLRGRIRTG